MARKRGAQARGGSIERHSLVFSRKTNAFRAGTASLPPPPAADSEVALPRKLREAMALKAGRNLLKERRDREQQPPPCDVGAKPPGAAGDRAQRPSPQQAVGVAAGDGVAKRKRAYLGAKARRKRARREKAAAEAADAAAPLDAPRFLEVAEAPPAMALARKHTLGALFEKQLQGAKSRVTAVERDSYIAAYRKLRGREALPFLATTEARSLI